ncbi:MAG TPA: YkgJ family cysteine cluster protein [Polyangiaceae bacterium]|nr:YkgJ family cysteine cluster protein [Polyangiaceae bacterium]
MVDGPSDARRAVEARLAEAPPALRLFFERELEKARLALAEGASVEHLAATLRAICERVAKLLETSLDARAIACRRGCSWCCRGLRVEVLAPEALTIARHLRSARQPAELSALLPALATQAELARQLSPQQLWQAQTPCIFLDQASGACSIYEARPIVCRLHHSLDRAKCERAASDQDATIPRHAASEDLYGLAQAALLLSCEERGLDARSLELASALQIALGALDVGERWADGERVFETAAFRPRDEPWPSEDFDEHG